MALSGEGHNCWDSVSSLIQERGDQRIIAQLYHLSKQEHNFCFMKVQKYVQMCMYRKYVYVCTEIHTESSKMCIDAE